MYKIGQNFKQKMIMEHCYGRPLLQAWLLPDLNTIPNNCVREFSLAESEPYISAMHLLISFFVTNFDRNNTKNGLGMRNFS